jgi:glycosyltransferase involved in cell wall biosynthesis
MRIAVMPHLPYWSIRTRGWQMAQALAALPSVECHSFTWGTTEPSIESRLLRGLDTLRRAVTNQWPRQPRVRSGATVHTLPLLDTRLTSAGVPLRFIQKHNQIRLTHLLEEVAPDWFITGGAYTAPVRWGSGVPTALDLFDDHFEGVSDLDTLRRLAPDAADALLRAHLVLGCSLGITRKYAALLGREVVYVPNGFDVTASAARPEEKDLARRRWKIPPNARVVGYLGNHGLHAGIRFLLQVATRLRERDPRVICAIGGPILDRRERWAAASHPAVRAVGPIPPEDVPVFLSACDIGVLPCTTTEFRSHAMPIKVLEYGARRLPAVASPLRELAIQGFPHVRLAPLGDLQAWTEAVEAALRTPFDPAWNEAIDRFAWPRIAQRLCEVLGNAR